MKTFRMISSQTRLIPSVLFILALFTIPSFAQIVSLSPSPATGDDQVVLTYDASQGNGGLVGAEKVYIHSGIITDSPDGTEWQNVIGNWGLDDGIGLMTKVSGQDNKWQITLSPTIREYYGATPNTNIFRLAMVFRNADGSKKGAGNPGDITGGIVTSNGDIFMDLQVSNYVTVVIPETDAFVLDENEAFDIRAEASATASSFVLSVDPGSGYQEIKSGSQVSFLEASYTPMVSGTLKIKANATINGISVETIEEFMVIISKPSSILPLPEGIRNGINYHPDDNTKVTLSLLAPGKELVYVVGDFNNWEIDENYLMNITPDGERFWLEISGLTPGQEYVFQYWVDGIIKIGDPYADKVADPWNDQFISKSVYPVLPAYDKTEYGIATVLQTDQAPFEWAPEEEDFEKPEKKDLIIYELLVRDFLGSHDYKDLTDTLSYLKKLGINAIELMPIMEFEGNESWGYNPAYFLAPDKYYGTKNDLKTFIQTAHKEGFAVILDMVLNHAFGTNAMVKMYWNGAQNRPAADNPWFNEEPTHPFNVGYDFNHESAYTRDFVDSVNLYWMHEYHFDGFRFDLSKGFTQTLNPQDVGKWGQYDQSRIDILTRMANTIWTYDPKAYVILEHFAEAGEEQTLANEGMVLWGNMNHTFKEAITGDNTSVNIAGAKSLSHVSYMESHDEQRQKYYIDTGGEHLGAYDIANFYTSLDRLKLGAAFFLPIPGPKMIWQFQELGYDVDINFNGRVGNKPLPWGLEGLGYYEDEERQKLLGTFSAILNLRQGYKQVFSPDNLNFSSTGSIKAYSVVHPDLEVVTIGNFGLEAEAAEQLFTKAGTWYNYLTAEEIIVSEVNTSITLQPGEFHIYVDREITFPEGDLVGDFQPIITVDPSSFSQKESIKMVFDAAQADPDGTGGLIGAEKVYMHSGVLLDPESTEWSNTVGNLDADDGIGLMQKVEMETDKWEITLIPEEYYGVTSGTRIFKIVMLFRDATNDNRGTGLGGQDLTLNVEADPNAAIVWTDPEIFSDNQEVTIYFDASLADPAGTAGLVGVDKVYMHSGTINDSFTGTGWDFVIGNWGQDDGIGQMTKVTGQTNQWQITLRPRQYYEVPSGTPIYRLGMVFRNGDGSREGKAPGGQDIFVNVEGVTGIDNADLQNQDILIYPNPAKDQVTFRFMTNFPDLLELRIYNIMGRLMDFLPLPSGSSDYTYSTSHLPVGLYFFEFSGKDTKESVRVIVE